MTFIEIVQAQFPTKIITQVLNNGATYADIVWNEFDTPPSEAEVTAAVADYIAQQNSTVTKFQFRKLFTFEERVVLDNFQSNTNIPANYKAILTTMFRDLESSSDVLLTLPEVVQGVNLLEQLGLIGAGRAAQVLANQTPSV